MKFPEPKRFLPKNKEKYRGDINNIWTRSGWETKLMRYFDLHPDVLWWSSEGISISYYSPVDKKTHKYFPDFIARVKNIKNECVTYVLEVKPYKQTVLPEQRKRKTKNYLLEVATFATNQAKWNAAQNFCKENGLIFKILTEKDIRF